MKTFKLITVVILAIFAVSNCFSQTIAGGIELQEDYYAFERKDPDMTNKINLISEGLKGNVKSITKVYFSASDKFGNIVKGPKQTFSIQCVYDKLGNQTEYKSYNRGVLESQNIYTYDILGNKIEYKHIFDGLVNKIDKFDKNNQRIERYEYSGGKLQSKEIFKYSIKKQMIESKQYDSNGSLKYNGLAKYDTNDNVIEWNEFNSKDKSISSRLKHNYDDQNKIIETNHYEYKYSINYDNGNKINVDSPEALLISRTEYLEGGNIVKKTEYHYDYGKSYDISICKYDNNDNPIEIIKNHSSRISNSGDYDSKNSEFGFEILKSKVTCKYDNNRLIEFSKYNSESKLEIIEKWK